MARENNAVDIDPEEELRRWASQVRKNRFLRPLLVATIPVFALIGEHAYQKIHGPYVDQAYSICTGKRDPCIHDFKPIPDAGFQAKQAAFGFDTKGDLVELRGFLKASITDPEAIRYVDQTVIDPLMAREEHQRADDENHDIGANVYVAMLDHLAKNMRYAATDTFWRRDASLLERMLDMKDNNAYQSFNEFISNGFRGQCDEISMATYVSYKIILNESQQKRDSSRQWNAINNYFSRNQIVIAILPQHSVNLIIHTGTSGEVIGYSGIEPQIEHKDKDHWRFNVQNRDGDVYLVGHGKEYPLLALISENAVYAKR